MLVGSVFNTTIQPDEAIRGLEKRLYIGSSHPRLLVVDGHWSILGSILPTSPYRS